MIKIILSVLIGGTLLSVLYAQEQVVSVAATDSTVENEYVFRSKPNIAVLPFYDANAQAKEVEFGRTVSAMLATALRSNTNFIVLERGELNQILNEQSIGSTGLTHEINRSFSELYNVDIILSGDVSLINSTLHIDARLTKTTSSKIVVALYSTCQDLKRIRVVVEELATQLEQAYLRQWIGRISIVSQPAGAEVYLGDRYIGLTTADQPLEINNLLEGRYHLKFIRGGYYDWEGNVSVLAKMERSVSVSMIAKPGSMNINSEPAGAQIFVDNSFIGVTPISLKKVAEGAHEIRLKKENYIEWTQRVVVHSFQPTDVKATLKVSPGILTINTVPAGASVSLKGNTVAETPHTLTNISPGEVVVHLEKPGYESWTTSVLISPNSHEVLDVHLEEKKGMFNVSSKPDSAGVYLRRADATEKTFIGYAPILNYKTTIGDYLVEVEKTDYFNGQKKISVLHDELTDVGIRLVEKPGRILVTTNPQNARIFLDGSFKGRSPLLLETIPKGTYEFKTSLPFAEKEQIISVQPNQETKINNSFKKSKDYIIPMTSIGALILILTLATK